MTVVVVALLSSPLCLAQLVVTSPDDSGAGTLREAVASANDGDEITFSSSLNGNPVMLATPVRIERDITISGNGMANTLIDGNGTGGRVLTILNSDVRLQNLTVRNGRTRAGGGIVIRDADSDVVLFQVAVRNNTATSDRANRGGGGIFNEGSLTLNRCVVTGNVASGESGSGGGIFNASEASLTLIDTDIIDNRANRAGGGIEDASNNDQTTVIRGGSIRDNVVNTNPGNGGGIHLGGKSSLGIFDCEVINNRAGAEGGGIWVGSGRLETGNTTIVNNVAAGDGSTQGGGGIYNTAGSLSLQPGTVIRNNQATGTSGSGGGVFNGTNGELFANEVIISDNTANRAGGGIEDNSGDGGSLFVLNSVMNDNSAGANPGNGGAIHITGSGDSDIQFTDFAGNFAAAEGGAIWNGTGEMNINGGTIATNTAAGNPADQGGGGVFNNGGTLRVNPGTRIVENRATGTSGSGGGILNGTGGTLEVNGATVSNNTANRAGGAIEDNSGEGGSLFVLNSVMNDNSTGANPGNGGAIHITGSGNSDIQDSDFAGNFAAAEGGALWNGSGMMTVIGGSIATNTAAGDLPTQGGGGIFNNGGTLSVIDGTVVSGNDASGNSGRGGGLFSTGGSVNVSDANFRDNFANSAGGGVEVAAGSYSSIDVDYSENVTGNAPGNGGAFHSSADGGMIEFVRGSIFNNSAFNEGGGVWNSGNTTMNIDNVNIFDNEVRSFGAIDKRVAGGGVFNNGGTVNIDNSSIFGNMLRSALGFTGGPIAITAGGGIANTEEGTVNLRTSTVSGNAASGGGGIANVGTMTVLNSTITANFSAVAGGYGQAIIQMDPDGSSSPSLTIGGSIISDNNSIGNLDFASVGGDVTSLGFNLIGKDLGFPAQSTDMENTAADLMPLTAEDGLFIHEPNCGSLAIDNGDPDDDSADQLGRGVFSGIRDIGAAEKIGSCPDQFGRSTPDLVDNQSISPDAVRVFPNPTRDGQLNVTLPEYVSGKVVFRIVDGSGRMLSETTHTAEGGGVRAVRVDALASGSYLLQVVNQDKTQHLRFVVTK
jgi:hypothetical protein